MRRRGFAAALLAVALLTGACGDDDDGGGTRTALAPAADEEQAAVDSWKTYKAAVLDADGPAAVRVLSAATVDYYGKLLDAALHDTQDALDARPVVDVVSILIARYEYPVAKLAALDARGYLELSITDGLIDESTVAGIDFERAEVSGDTAELLATGQNLQRLDMRKESGVWKVHLVTLIREVGRALDRLAAERGQSPSEASLALIQAARSDADAGLFAPLQ